MLDPITALSVAGNVVQFVDFGKRVLQEGYLLYMSNNGATSVNEELSLVTNDLLKSIAKLKIPIKNTDVSGCSTETEQELQNLCLACTKVAEELLARLKSSSFTHRLVAIGGVEMTRVAKVWHSLWAALQDAWTQEERVALLKRLSVLRQAIETQILVGIRERIDLLSLKSSSRFDSLDEKSRQVVVALLDTRHSLSRDLQDQTLAIAQMLSRTEVAVLAQHDRTRAVIVDALRHASGLNQTNRAPRVRWEEEVIVNYEKEEASLKSKVERTILDSLSFSTMTDRIDEVPEAYTQTFRWIFDEPMAQSRHWSSFVEWLRKGSGIYWISGKAASGKSTLLRYIHYHAKTLELLDSWAKPLELVTANFFFWNSGTLEQRSQTGLLRALLYEILRRQQELIPVILPSQWARTYSELLDPASQKTSAQWKLPELMRGIRLLANKEIINVRLFLLIDGLDEYESDYGEVAELLRSIADSPHLKICVSSRPLLVFDDAFHDCPALRLHDLTQEDIRQYVTGKLGGHSRFQLLAAKEPERAPALIEDIVTKANGVFLWVKLVVQSLLSGLGNRDGITDLQRRLLLIPADLEDLYMLMLKRIDPFYITKASEMFQLVHAQRDLDWQWQGRDQQPFTILALAMADHERPRDILASRIGPWTADEILATCSEMEDRLKVRCAGLLEVQRHENLGIPLGIIEPLHWQSKVQYIHRTARDYLEGPNVWSAMVKHTLGTDFYPYTSLLRSGVLQVKLLATRAVSITFGSLCDIAINTMIFANLVESKLSHPNTEWLDQLNDAMCYCQKNWSSCRSRHWTDRGNLASLDTWENSFLSFAIQYNLGAYLASKLAVDEKLLRNKRGRPLLDYAVNPIPRNEHSHISANIVETLLKHGADPNQTYRGSTPWENTVRWQVHYNHDVKLGQVATTPEITRNRATTLRLLLEFGADQKFRATGPEGPFSVLSISRMFLAAAPAEAKTMECILSSKRAGRKNRGNTNTGVLKKMIKAVRI